MTNWKPKTRTKKYWLISVYYVGGLPRTVWFHAPFGIPYKKKLWPRGR